MTEVGSVPMAARHGPAYVVHLLGGFRLRCDGRVVNVLPSARRLVALLALHDRALPRAYVAATLWPETTDERAGANLRTTLWRLSDSDRDVVEVAGPDLTLRHHVWVDARFVSQAARRHRSSGDLPGPELLDLVPGVLLPGCWDSWLVFERERLREELIHLYEAFGAAMLERGQSHPAVLAGLAAVECDPLRESSNVLLIRAYTAAGDHVSATRSFRRYAILLRSEIGVDPDATMRTLLRVS